MLKNGVLEDIDVLKAGHHGSSSSTGSEFLEIVKPEYAIISCGAGNSYNHPSASVMKRLGGKTQRKRDNIIIPDVLCDFTDLPFPDDSFALVVMDPPPYCKSKRDGMVG